MLANTIDNASTNVAYVVLEPHFLNPNPIFQVSCVYTKVAFLDVFKTYLENFTFPQPLGDCDRHRNALQCREVRTACEGEHARGSRLTYDPVTYSAPFGVLRSCVQPQAAHGRHRRPTSKRHAVSGRFERRAKERNGAVLRSGHL